MKNWKWFVFVLSFLSPLAYAEPKEEDLKSCLTSHKWYEDQQGVETPTHVFSEDGKYTYYGRFSSSHGSWKLDGKQLTTHIWRIVSSSMAKPANHTETYKIKMCKRPYIKIYLIMDGPYGEQWYIHTPR